MDNLVRTSDITVTLCQRTRWPTIAHKEVTLWLTTGPLGVALRPHKISKAERTPTPHREHPEHPESTQG